MDISDDKLRKVLDFIVRKIPSKEEYQKQEPEIYKRLGVNKDSGIEFKQHLENKFKEMGWKPDLSEDEMINLAKKINYGPLYHAIAKRISPAKRKEAFPEIAGKFEAAGAPAAGAAHGTTTANTAPYPIPLGTLAPSATRGPDYSDKKKNKKKKKKKKSK